MARQTQLEADKADAQCVLEEHSRHLQMSQAGLYGLECPGQAEQLTFCYIGAVNAEASQAITSLWSVLSHRHSDVNFISQEQECSRMPDDAQSLHSQPCIAKLVQGRAVAFMPLPAAQLHEELLALQVKRWLHCHGLPAAHQDEADSGTEEEEGVSCHICGRSYAHEHISRVGRQDSLSSSEDL
ncbi:hypothetical protein WJX84_000047 [Apatococcus fuscideae]|uniref:Uncharacterized protein n=1 Tax=Apatococcus fuscideae TaxID=2026836 RepID=A0AAW1TGR2_9CHLO